jgi:hypothetical protein
MAKKVKAKNKEEEFQFPPFDEEKFLQHEFEQTWADVIGAVVAILLGIVSWAIVGATALWFLPVIVALAVFIATPFLFHAIRPQSFSYKWSDWAGIIAIEFFGWLGLWFLLSDILAGAHPA